MPTLELLATQLSLKYLNTVFEDGLIPVSQLESIVLFVDSQVALTWILTNKVPPKNIFVNNRLKEISKLLDNFKCKYVPVSFSYIPSEYNHADFLTKHCGSGVFKEKFEWWINGAKWMLAPPHE